MLSSTSTRPTLCTIIKRALPLQVGTTMPPARRTMTAFSQMSDNDPDVLEKEKLKQVNNKDEKNWQEKLATHSEAAIKADKEFDKSTKDLQDESLNILKNEK